MLFIAGIIVGLLIAIFIFLLLTFFKISIEKYIKIVDTKLVEAGPKPKGYIFEPPDDVTEARERIIEKNNQEGRDTKIEELL